MKLKRRGRRLGIMTAKLPGLRMRKIFSLAFIVCGLSALPVQAQETVPSPAFVYQLLPGQQLDQLLGPIALYPDPLIAQILAASTLPAQIVLADRYVAGGGDPNQVDQQPWDTSVQALARCPEVLKWLDDNLNWTTELGQTFLNQQQDVMDSIQRLRAEAQNLGNLQSTSQQQVVVDGGTIEILPANPQMVYVPEYSPETVYYDRGFGAPSIAFGIGIQIGAWLNSDIDWRQHHLVVWDRDHPRPADWERERPDQRAAAISRQTTVWQPENHRAVGVVNRADRGWPENPPARPAVARAGQPAPPPVPARAVPPNGPRPQAVPATTTPRTQPARVQQSAPPRPSASNGAFIGIQSSSATRTFSQRGQQSMQASTHSAPVSHPAPSSNGNAGGGNRGPGTQQKH